MLFRSGSSALPSVWWAVWPHAWVGRDRPSRLLERACGGSDGPQYRAVGRCRAAAGRRACRSCERSRADAASDRGAAAGCRRCPLRPRGREPFRRRHQDQVTGTPKCFSGAIKCGMDEGLRRTRIGRRAGPGTVARRQRSGHARGRRRPRPRPDAGPSKPARAAAPESRAESGAARRASGRRQHQRKHSGLQEPCSKGQDPMADGRVQGRSSMYAARGRAHLQRQLHGCLPRARQGCRTGPRRGHARLVTLTGGACGSRPSWSAPTRLSPSGCPPASRSSARCSGASTTRARGALGRTSGISSSDGPEWSSQGR